MPRPHAIIAVLLAVLATGHSVDVAGDSPEFVMQWGTPGNGPGQLAGPHGIVVAPNGDLYVADTGNNRVQRFTADGVFVTSWGFFGAGDGQFNHPHGIGVDIDGNVFVAATGNNRVQKFTATGTFLLKWGSFGNRDGQFLHNHGLGVDRQTGHVYVADRDQNRVQKFTNDGTFVAAWGSSGVGIPLLALLAVGVGAGPVIAIGGAAALAITAFIGLRWRQIWALQ